MIGSVCSPANLVEKLLASFPATHCNAHRAVGVLAFPFAITKDLYAMPVCWIGTVVGNHGDLALGSGFLGRQFGGELVADFAVALLMASAR